MKNLILAGVIAAAQAQENKRTCTALVMSGGGSNGAWEAGVVWGLAHYGNPDDYHYDVVSGVSAGSINTSLMSIWAPEDAVKASEFMVDTWQSLTTDQIYKKRTGGDAWALFEAVSIYDSAPGLDTYHKVFAPFDGFKRKITISAVDANTGMKITMTDKEIEFKDLPIAVMGSASVPGVFPVTEYLGHHLIDGMTAYNTDVQATIDRCKDIVGEYENNITIDVLQISSPATADVWDSPAMMAYSNYSRASDLKDAHVGGDQLEAVKRAHPHIHWRHEIVQSVKTTGTDELSFEQTVLQPLIDYGKQDAQTALNARAVNEDLTFLS